MQKRKRLFFIAMEEEALPIIKHFKLEKVDKSYYKDEDNILFITGIGVANILQKLYKLKDVNLYLNVNLKISSRNEMANPVTDHIKMLLFHSDYNIYKVGTQTMMQI